MLLTVVILIKNKKNLSNHTLTSIKFSNDLIFTLDKNQAIKDAKNNWILFLENGDKIIPSLFRELKIKTKQKSYDGYFIKKKIKYENSLHFNNNSLTSQYLILGKKNKGNWDNESWNIEGEIGVISSPIISFSKPTLSDFITEINEYTSIRSKELFYEDEKVNYLKIIYLTFRRFIKEFIINKKILNGFDGFIVSVLLSFSVFVLFVKLWSIRKNNSNPDNF